MVDLMLKLSFFMCKKVKDLFVRKVRGGFLDLSLCDKFYKAGEMLVLMYMVVGVITLLIFGHKYLDFVAKVFVAVVTLTCTVGVAIEYWGRLRPLFGKTWFQWVLGVASVLVYKYSESQSDDFINQFAGVDPSFLSFASSVLAVLYLPYSWLVTISFFMSFYVIFHWVYIPFEKPSSERSLGGYKYLLRFMGLAAIYFIAIYTVSVFDDPKSFVSKVAGEIVLKTEYFPKSHCRNVEVGQLSADIGRGYVSIFNISDRSFHVEKCAL